MIRVAVIAHFLSANMGDRYQGVGLAERLVSSVPGIIVDRINSHAFNRDVEVETVSNLTPTHFEVINPDRVDYASYDFAILPTGSIDDKARFVGHALEFLSSSKLKRLVVWGGFHDITDFISINEATAELLKRLFQDQRTIFYARGWLELAVYHMLVGGGRGRCGGDPVLLNDFSAYRALAPSSIREATIVINGHAFGKSDAELNSLKEIISAFPRICYFDVVADRKLIKSIGEEKVWKANTIATFAEVATSSSIIVSQRLHGLAFAKALSPALPVILWVPKMRKNIKFHSVAESAAGFGLGIAHVWENFTIDDALSAIKNPDSYLRREHELNFAYYMELTNKTFREIVRLITSD